MPTLLPSDFVGIVSEAYARLPASVVAWLKQCRTTESYPGEGYENVAAPVFPLPLPLPNGSVKSTFTPILHVPFPATMIDIAAPSARSSAG